MSSLALNEMNQKNLPAVPLPSVGYSPLQQFATNRKRRELIAQWNLVNGELVCQWNIVEP